MFTKERERYFKVVQEEKLNKMLIKKIFLSSNFFGDFFRNSNFKKFKKHQQENIFLLA
jgi:hypothetical protein